MKNTYKYIHLDDSVNGLIKISLTSLNSLWSLNEQSAGELLEVVRCFNANDAYKVLLLTGSGLGFCVGADLNIDFSLSENELLLRLAEDTNDQMSRLLNPLVDEIFNSPKATVCAVNGVTAGGGVGLALAADIVIAAESARFIQVFMPRLGIMPDMGCTWLMSRLVGRSRALALAMLGEAISAKDAERFGMIWKSVEDDLLEHEAKKIANQLLTIPLNTIGSFKEAVKASENRSYSEQLNLERDLQARLCGSENFVEGVKAFKEKRDPRFGF